MTDTTSSRKESFTLSLPLAIVAGSILIAAAILFVGHKDVGGTAATGSSGSIHVRAVSAEDHIIGSSNAPVVLIEYADLQCPYCNLADATFQKIVDNSNGQVAWVFRNFPLESIHPEARPAAEAAECIAGLLGNDAFWKFTDAIYADQQHIGSDLYMKEAAALGADPQAFADCVSKKTYNSRIDTDLSEAVLSGGEGTPFTVVVGKKGEPVAFSGALPYEQISAIINSVKNR